MRRSKFIAVAAATVALALTSSPAVAQPPEEPGCEGRFIQFGNQFFNYGSPSGNENAAAGPGLFFKNETGEHIHRFRAIACP